MQCVVVGGGVSGMSAALLLARHGHKVALAEQASRLAPLLRGFQRGGLRFDTGFHCGGGLHPGGILADWLRTLGLDEFLPSDVIRPLPEQFLFPDGTRCDLLPDGSAIPDSLERQFPGYRNQVLSFLRELNDGLSHSPYTNPQLRGEKTPFFVPNEVTVAERLAVEGLPPRLETVLAARCVLYGVPPGEASWADFQLVAGPYFQSCRALVGGGATLAAAFEKALLAAKVELCLNADVVALRTGPGREIRAVGLADGRELPCELCVFTGHPAQLEALLPAGLLRPAYFRHIREMPETLSGLLLFGESEALPEGRSWYLLPYQEMSRLFVCEDEENPTVYLATGFRQDHSLPGSAPAKGSVPVVAVAPMRTGHVPEGDPSPRPEVYQRWKRDAAARLAASMERRMPELRGAWRVLDAATALSFRRWIRGGTGSLYGMRHDRHAVPLLPVTRAPGLFLAGQNILLPGVLGGIVSAALAVGFALGHETVLKDFQSCARNG